MKNCHVFDFKDQIIFKSRYDEYEAIYYGNGNGWEQSRIKVSLTVLPERLVSNFFNNVITSLGLLDKLEVYLWKALSPSTGCQGIDQ